MPRSRMPICYLRRRLLVCEYMNICIYVRMYIRMNVRMCVYACMYVLIQRGREGESERERQRESARAREKERARARETERERTRERESERERERERDGGGVGERERDGGGGWERERETTLLKICESFTSAAVEENKDRDKTSKSLTSAARAVENEFAAFEVRAEQQQCWRFSVFFHGEKLARPRCYCLNNKTGRTKNSKCKKSPS